MKKLSLVVLILCILLAAVLRLPFLDKYPPGATGDEIQQGYTAYSLLLTGKDEWGDVLPIYPRSFGDYRPPLYSYLDIPFVAVFGLNIASVRFPSAIFGILSVLVMFFLVRELFKSELAGLVASFVLAVSNWHVFYSRMAWESNPGAFLFLLGLYLFLKGLKSGKYLIFASICFGLTLFSYYSYKLMIPLFVLGLGVLYFKQLKIIPRKTLVISILVFLLFFVVMSLGDVFSGGGRRASDAAIYNVENLEVLRNTQIEDKLPQPWGRLINNRLGYLITQFNQNYLGYFSTTFFTSPHRPDSSLYNLSGEWLMSVGEFLLILIALFIIIRKTPEFSRIILLWALVTPIPAALTRNYMHVQRVEILLFLIPVLVSYGFYWVYKNLNYKRVRLPLFILLSGLALYSFMFRVDHYLFHTFTHDLGGMHYGYDEIFKYTEANKDKYDSIIFTKEQSEPQIFLAFYTKMDPQIFQQNSQNWKYFEKEGFKFLDMINYKLDKYYFTNIDWDKEKQVKNRLIIGSDRQIPDGIKPIFVVKDPFGKVLFKVIDTNGQI